MSYIRLSLSAVALTGLISLGAAFAQTPSPSPSPTTVTTTTEPSTVSKVEKWSTKEWNAAKSKWAKEKTKWADCRQQSVEQKLTGRKSWGFLYDCMTGSNHVG
jgi:hypothetical protein